MKDNEIMISVKFITARNDEKLERYMNFLVMKDITFGELIEGIYYGLKKRKIYIEKLIKEYKENNQTYIENTCISDSMCFDILKNYLKKNSYIVLNNIFKNNEINKNGIIYFDSKNKEDCICNYNYKLNELGIVTSTCIIISDIEENIENTTPLFNEKQINYIIRSNNPEYNISNRIINVIESSVINIIPAGSMPPKNSQIPTVITAAISVGLMIGMRFTMGSLSGTTGNMVFMSIGMGMVSFVTTCINSIRQYFKSIGDQKKWKENYENYILKTIRKIIKFQKQDILYLNTAYPSIEELFKKVESIKGDIFKRSYNDDDFFKISLGKSDEIKPLFEIKDEKKENGLEDNIRYKLDISTEDKNCPFTFEILVPEKEKKKKSKIKPYSPYLSEIAYNFAHHTYKNKSSYGFRYLRDYSDNDNKPPLVFDMKNCGVLGVVSDKYEISQNLIRHIVFELAFYHSPENLQFVFFFKRNENVDERNKIIENYKYLPHSNELFENSSQFVFDEKSAGEAFSKLFNIVNLRSESEKENDKSDDQNKGQSEKSEIKHTQIVCVVFDDYDIKRTAFSRFLPEAPKQGEDFKNTLGLSFIFLQDNKDKLPKYCESIINLNIGSGTIHKRYNMLHREEIADNTKNINHPVQENEDIIEKKKFENDYIFGQNQTIEKYEKAYKQLSSIYYKRVSENGKVPSKVSLFDIWKITKKDIENNKVEEKIKKLWDNSNITKDLRIPVGMNEHGITYLDMHQNGDGPHGLVAGTTGSGKSETLITYIIGCCMKYKPEDLNFMLIDMKGGGFSERLGRLPHLVGSVTNTTGEKEGISSEYMLKRFLCVLNYEIKKREFILQELDTDNIDSYIEARKKVMQYRQDIRDNKITLDKIINDNKGKNKDKFCKACDINEPEPEILAHLLLIVDEFTELKRFSNDSNGIDFIKDITTIARVGRTLGFHIILVSQNIEGAITEDIRVNSKARICLRVATKGASKDMIGTTDAAAATMPYNGRAYMLVNGTLEYFQSAYTKANKNISIKEPVNISYVPEIGDYEKNFYNSDKDNERLNENPVDEDDSQLNYIINTINSIVEKNGEEYKLPSKLFLEPLKAKEKSITDNTGWRM